MTKKHSNKNGVCFFRARSQISQCHTHTAKHPGTFCSGAISAQYTSVPDTLQKILPHATENKHIEINHLANKQGFTVIVCGISIINPVKMNYRLGTRRLPGIPLLHFSLSFVTWQKYVKSRRARTHGAVHWHTNTLTLMQTDSIHTSRRA